MNRARSVLSFGSVTNERQQNTVLGESKENFTGDVDSTAKEPVEVDLLELRNIRDRLDSLQVESDSISKETFLQVVLDSTEHDKTEAEGFFELLDVRNLGNISLQRFISGYSLFCRITQSERIRYLFYMFDEDNDGFLKFSDLEDLQLFIHKYFVARGYSMENEKSFSEDIWHSSLNEDSAGTNSVEHRISFQDFRRLAQSSPVVTSFLQHLDQLIGPTNGTLRETKEGDLLALELERISTSRNLTSTGITSEEDKTTKTSIRRTKRENFSSPFAIDYESLTFVRKIGKGSFAEVWAGQWLHMPVAIKVFGSLEYEEDDTTSCSELRMKNFLAEVETLSQLRHPNVLLYMGACIDPEKPLCIVSELFNGGSVYDYLHGLNAKPFSTTQATFVALGVARGMHYLHSSIPIVLHRDLKSSNVLVDKHLNHVVICDFGLSILADNRSQSTRKKKTAKQSFGTPYTMAPEVMLGETYRAYSDVYSFSILLWEIFTGRQPFAGLKPIQMMFQVSEGKRPPLVRGSEEFSESPEDLDSVPDAQLIVPRRIAKLIKRGWNAEPEKRPAFEEILLELEQFQTEISSASEENNSINQIEAERLGFDHSSKEVIELQRCMTLMNAVAKNDIPTVEQHLAKYPQDIHFADYDQRTPLHIAASEGYEDMARLLMRNGAKLAVSDRWQRTPLDDAISNKHYKVVELFKQFVKDESWKNHPQQTSTLVICLELMDAVFRGDVDRVALLLEAGAPVNYSDYDRRTPLHVAASEGHADVVSLLLQYGAKTNKVDRWGSTPIDDAKRGHFEDCYQILKRASSSNG